MTESKYLTLKFIVLRLWKILETLKKVTKADMFNVRRIYPMLAIVGFMIMQKFTTTPLLWKMRELEIMRL